MNNFEPKVDYTKSRSWQSFPNSKKQELIDILTVVVRDPSLKTEVSDVPGEYLSTLKRREAAARPACKIIAEHYEVDKVIEPSMSVYRTLLYHTPEDEKISKVVETYLAAESIAKAKIVGTQIG